GGVSGDRGSDPPRDPGAAARWPIHRRRDRGELSYQPAGDLQASAFAAFRGLGRCAATRHGADLRTECKAAARGRRLAPGLRNLVERESGQSQALPRGRRMNQADTNDPIVKQITIKASAERIFEALTNPDQRVKWWGAEGRFQTTSMESDLRPGGRWVM